MRSEGKPKTMCQPGYCFMAGRCKSVRMPDDSLHQPHDKLFIGGFSDPVTAAAFLQAELPVGVSGLIAWTDLKFQSGTFIDSQFRHSKSDLLFATTVAGKDCRVYLLFEHQSAPDPWLALRLLRYMVRIWEAHI
jgi:predicted transposase/invertase (TIGR01784 family)